MFSFSHLHLHLSSTTCFVFVVSRSESDVWVQGALLSLLRCAGSLDFRATKLPELLPYSPFHLRKFKDHPQRNQENTEQSEAPAQSVSPGGIDVGFVELERLVSHQRNDEGTLSGKKNNYYFHPVSVK